MDVCINKEGTHAHIDEEERYAHIKGTGVCIPSIEEGTHAHIDR
jgi:hypothetical protein